MSFCKPSNELLINNKTLIENAFILDFLPSLDFNSVKVYLFGLYLCQNGVDNTIETFTKTFDLSEEDIISIFKNLEELKLVECIDLVPFEVRYLKINNSSMHLKKFNKDKYKNFNLLAQEILSKRMIDIKEFENYYYLIEFKGIDQEALIKIIEFCAYKKGANINASYILKVCKDWINDGIKTAEQVENRIKDQEKYNDDLKMILSTLGIKRSALVEEYQMFLDWINNLSFQFETLLHLAKLTKKKKGNFLKLNALVNKCYELKKFSVKEIDEYFSKVDEFYGIAKDVCFNLGLRYDNLSIVVESYITNWNEFGYDKQTLNCISKYCFKCNIKTLEGMNTKINQFYKLGLIDVASINEYIDELSIVDGKIKSILDRFGLNRMVNYFDRNFYNTWVNDWNINEEVLNYAVSLSADKFQPMQFLNKVLGTYHKKGINSVEKAKQENLDFINNYQIPKGKKQSSKYPHARTYSKEQIESLFDNVNEVEI